MWYFYFSIVGEGGRLAYLLRVSFRVENVELGGTGDDVELGLLCYMRAFPFFVVAPSKE